MLLLPALQVFVTSSLVLFYKEMGIFRLGFFLVFMIDCVVFSVCAPRGAAEIYIVSSKWKQNWLERARVSKREMKLVKKELRSIRKLRVQVSDNFVDTLTPLVVQHFCLEKTATIFILHSVG